MTKQSLEPAELEATRAKLEQASSLPTRAYTDAAVFALERERIFAREWLAVARLEQVEAAGDYLAKTIAGEPIVVVRGQDGRVRALSRVCRHRSALLVEGAGHADTLECPYHRWIYALDGKLLATPLMQGARGFERSAFCLPEYRVETWGGFVYVNLDPDAEPLAPRLAPLAHELAALALEELRVARTLEFDSPWNWKVLVDNFMESYHHLCPHRETLLPIYPAADTYAVDSDGPWALLVNPSKQPDFATLLVANVFPCQLFALLRDHGFWYELEIESADRFALRIHALVPQAWLDDPAKAGEIDALCAGLELVHRQDIAICESVWRGLKARSAAPGRYSPLEKALWQFNQWWLARVA
jgi:phenylpropionate dioxygenase-like ring-hydroxylating dioxygenase large terminal subunit